MILLITNKSDITTDIIVDRLQKKKLSYYRLNTEDIPEMVSVSFKINENSFLLYDKKKNTVIDCANIKSVYYRRPQLSAFPNEKFIRNEIFYTLEGLYKFLEGKYWLSPVWAIRQAENKIYQLLIAQEEGLSVPESIITTDQRDFIQFTKKCQCIIKPVRSGFIDEGEDEKIVFTSRLNITSDLPGRAQLCPNFLQNEIIKDSDIRVTIVGKTAFSAKIDSQQDKDAEVDWRRSDALNLPYHKFDLPSDIFDKCIRVMTRLNLEFGAFDFILDKKGYLHFLEVNPNGQWAWIEKRLGFDISGKIVEKLHHVGR